MIRIASSYSIFNALTAEQGPRPDLQAIISRWTPQRIRRIDRYIQLCLAGGLSCVAGRELPTETGLYLATRYGAVATSAQVISTIEQEGQLPKPVHFVNSLGNSAGFYLTQLLQITGNTLVVSQEEFSFEAALLHACLDLNSGRISTALIGGFDEVTLPFAQQLERLGLAANTAVLHEGSHWLLLEQSNDASSVLQTPVYFNNLAALSDWLQQQSAAAIQLSFAPNADEQTLLAPYPWQEFSRAAVIQGVYSGAALTALAAQAGRAIHLNRNSLGEYCAVIIEG
ncbi:hypothetical protein [Gilvimarinus polysaccharolyticus]|uniref:hypothetical protein n=1 Tax=Gilvimarinus polysaccharolyticus TaxID=863921 RepID=UPI00067319A3|nr:hypothetical protein [Gilvimarinus polysaccharolyticus]